MTNVLEWLKDNREKSLLIGYLGLILVLVVPIARMIRNAYVHESDLTRELVNLPGVFGITKAETTTFGVGVLVGFLLLMTLDHKKRIQAILLWLGIVVSFAVLSTAGVLVDNLDIFGNVPWLLGGVVVGLVLGGGRRLLRINTIPNYEFRRASLGVYVLIVSATLAMFVEMHLVYPDFVSMTNQGLVFNNVQDFSVSIDQSGLLVNFATVALFVGVVNRFIQYDADRDFFIVGPRASGKSLFLIGAYLEALERAKSSDKSTPLNPSEDLMSMMEALDRQDAGWIVEATGRGELNHLEFQYVHGSVFPTNITLAGYDYAGEYLERLPDAITGATDDDDMDTTLRRLADGIKDADTLILIIDVERFINNRSLEISPYFSILQAADNKDVMLVATKADLLADEFEDERGLEPHLYFEEFKGYVNDRLRQNENINSLVTQVGDRDIHPVYYQTTTDEQDNRIPRRDDSGSVLTVGFDELLTLIGGR